MKAAPIRALTEGDEQQILQLTGLRRKGCFHHEMTGQR